VPAFASRDATRAQFLDGDCHSGQKMRGVVERRGGAG
jgi:hypothetical protein